MLTNGKSFKIISGNSNRPLAEEIASILGVTLADVKVSKFNDGEVKLEVNETVRGHDLFIIQSTSEPVNDNLMELLIMIDAFKRASAGKITAVIPYFGYARQDRKAKPRDPISAKLVADLITKAGADRILTMDLHVPQIQGFFDIPVDHILGVPAILVPHYKEKFKDELEDIIVVSPDVGSAGRVRIFAKKLNVPMAIVDKRRPEANVSEIMNVIGDVSGKKVLLVDDLIDTAGTITNSVTALLEKGARQVQACCIHPVLSGPAISRITKSDIKELVVLNTINLPENKKLDKIKILSAASIIADVIDRIYNTVSVSNLFR